MQKNQVSKNSLYWICQILGWGAHFTNEIFSYTISFGYDQQLIINAATNFGVAIVLTHTLRYFFQTYEWIKLPVGGMALRMLICIALMTNALVALNLPLDAKYTEEIFNRNPILTIQYFISLAEPLLIWSLIYVFYHYIEVLKTREIEKVQLVASKNNAEAQVLRAQMNPHFIFNALNSIRALVIEDPSKAQNGITQLSNILRSSLLADRRTMVQLKEELSTIQDYLALEKIRYEERLQIKWDIDPKSLTIFIPPMIIQTLVENAIKHGVQKAIKWGFIHIKVKNLGLSTALEIINTGILKGTESKKGGLGLQNTAQRLKLIYGDKAIFTIKQRTDTEVICYIEIPNQHETAL